MSDLYEYGDLGKFYSQSHDATIAELNKLIIALRTRVHYLEDLLQEREKTGVPRVVEKEIENLIAENKKLHEELEFYKSKVPDWVIINRENKKKPTRKGGIPK